MKRYLLGYFLGGVCLSRTQFPKDFPKNSRTASATEVCRYKIIFFLVIIVKIFLYLCTQKFLRKWRLGLREKVPSVLVSMMKFRRITILGRPAVFG